MSIKTFWHVTPATNWDGIIANGIDPECAKGARKLVWFVQWRGIPHALAHVSARHSIPVDRLYAIRVRIDDKDVTHHRLYMYFTKKVCKRGLCAIRGDYALMQWEKQRSYYTAKGKGEARAQ